MDTSPGSEPEIALDARNITRRYGAVVADGGTIAVDGAPVVLRRPSDALDAAP